MDFDEIARRIAEREANHERLSRAAKERHAALSPEEKERRKAKAAETRRRNAERERQRRIEAAEERAKKEDRYRRAAETRRRNQGFEGLTAEEIKAVKRQRKRDAKEAEYGPPKPTVRRSVPGGQGVLYDFEGILRSYIAKRATFWLYVDQSGGPDACWPWHGARGIDYSTGKELDYGAASWEGRPVGAHRVAWMLDSGWYIPPGLVIDHMCEVTWCVNPNHLLCTTHSYNLVLRRKRPPELSRVATSHEPPWDDRWYPQGRRPRKDPEPEPERIQEPVRGDQPATPFGLPSYEPLIPDDEEF